MPRAMGFDFGLGSIEMCLKRKFRWLLKIDGVCAQGVNTLPPSKSARPQLSFKEMDIPHLTETVYFPSRPEWKPVALTLFDLKTSTPNPVWAWIKKCYEVTASASTFKPAVPNQLKKQGTLELYDGCGNTIETWVFQNMYPQDINFGDLDMGVSEYLTCDLQLRYDRAYLVEP